MDDAARNCDWNVSLVQTLLKRARTGTFLPAGVLPPEAGFALSLEVVQFRLQPGSKESEYSATVRADLRFAGKLVATHDEEESSSFKEGKACTALQEIGKETATSIANWLSTTRFPECHDNCQGIHPDEPIAISMDIPGIDADSVDPALKAECNWDGLLVKELIKLFNTDDPPPRALLKVSAKDLKNYPGRKLMLHVGSIHTISGGMFTGPKWITLLAELVDGGIVVADLDIHMHNMTGGVTACSVLEGLTDDVADGIAQWLLAPSIGSKKSG